jgi:hypothetical protein
MGLIRATAPARRNELAELLSSVPQPIRAQVEESWGFVKKDSVRKALASEEWTGQSVASLPQRSVTIARAVLVDFLWPEARLDTKASQEATTSALRERGVEELSLEKLGPKAYAKEARAALLSYLPKEDVDSARALESFLAPKTEADMNARARSPYVHHLSKNADGSTDYSSGFLMHNPRGRFVIDGHSATVLQVDFCSALEKDGAKLEVGKLELERLIQSANAEASKHGRPAPDFAFVEASGVMLERYAELGFKPLAMPGTKSDGDAYVMMALPLSDAASAAMNGTRFYPSQRRELWEDHVEAWLDTNWRDQQGPNWRQDPRATEAYRQMISPANKGPIWNQVLPE